MTATSDIVVHRCLVRVVRHGGWSWGLQPQRLVDQVLAALPALIAEQLAGLAPDSGSEDVEITEPVRITVSLPLADLLSGQFDALQQVAMASESLPELAAVSGAVLQRAPAPPHRTPFAERTPHRDACAKPTTLAEFASRLYESGELGPFLALLPIRTLEAWYESLVVPVAEGPATGPEAGDRLADGTSHLAAHLPDQPTGKADTGESSRSRQLQDAISAIAARISRGNGPGPGATGDLAPGLHDRLAPAAAIPAGPQPPGAAQVGSQPPGIASSTSAAAVPPGTAATSSARRQPQNAATVASALTAAGADSAGRTTSTNPAAMTSGTAGPAHVAQRVANAVVDVTCALPFLLLGPLAQSGYLSALGPALQPAELQAQTAVFATALAYTVLGPLERAWRRRPEDLAAAAAFAGLGTPLPGQALTEFARVAAPALPALDAVVTRALAEGHSAGEPLVLVGVGDRADAGLVLFDREGLFPVAWADSLAGLMPTWQTFGSPPVLVAPTAVGALRGLTDAGAGFVVATPPARTERWRRLPPHRLWTNHGDPVLARHAGGYQQAVDLAAELTQALAVEHAAIPLAAGPALGRSLLLAAGLGLGTLAWTLWRQREPTDPLLALERFADLSARISFEPDRVRVRLPLGPRHSDLSVHGLLADVRGVPWFGGRVVEFSGG
jgi:hypothetical protein